MPQAVVAVVAVPDCLPEQENRREDWAGTALARAQERPWPAVGAAVLKG